MEPESLGCADSTQAKLPVSKKGALAAFTQQVHSVHQGFVFLWVSADRQEKKAFMRQAQKDAVTPFRNGYHAIVAAMDLNRLSVSPAAEEDTARLQHDLGAAGDARQFRP